MITLAQLGCGYWGPNLLRNFSALPCRVKWVVEQSEARRSFVSEKYPDIRTAGDWSEVLQDPEVDAVVIATPAATHSALSEAALKADKHVFVEKPLALTYDEGAALVRLAEARNRILMVGHVLEYHPAMTRLFSLVRSGEIGRVQYIYSNRLSLGQVRREENILWSFAPHDVAVILRLMGSMPFQVVACGGSYVQANIADVTLTHLLFDNGVRAHIHVSWLHPYKEQRLVIIGSKKMISFDDVAKKLLLYDQRVEWKEGLPVPVKSAGEEVDFGAEEPLRMECSAYLEAIHTGQPPITDGMSGLRVLQVLQAAQRSLVMNGEPVSLPMETFGATV